MESCKLIELGSASAVVALGTGDEIATCEGLARVDFSGHAFVAWPYRARPLAYVSIRRCYCRTSSRTNDGSVPHCMPTTATHRMLSCLSDAPHREP